MAKDIIHQIVVTALEKDGWNVNFDPLYIEYDTEESDFEIDLGAEKLIAASRENDRIAVEIKSFRGSMSNGFHTALGQFLDYEAALAQVPEHSDRTLYIAIPKEVYYRLDSIPFFRQRIIQHGLRFIAVNLETESIATWIN